MSAVRPIRDARLGTVLRGTYRLETVLGRGAAGAVYRAVNVHDGSLAAVKVLRASQGPSGTADTALPDDEDEESRHLGRRFAREARIVAELHHPNIVKVFAFEAESEGGEAYLAMELLDGEPLGQLLRRRILSPAEGLELYRPLCSAMSYAHAHGVVHRDLKPDNVFLVGGHLHDPRVLDFGISKVLLPDASQLTTDAILGTPAYMAPELVRAPAQVDRRADLFALGAMLFHALTGYLPFDGDTVLAVLHKVLQGHRPSARQHRPELPPALDAVLIRCMAHDPRQRFQDAAELLAALEDAVRPASDPREPAPTALLPQVIPEERHAEAVAQTLMMPQVGAEPLRRTPAGSGPEPRLPVPGAEPALPPPLTAAPMEPSLSLALRPKGRRLLPPRWWLAALVGGAVGALLALLGLR